jgi:hypothetical protein
VQEVVLLTPHVVQDFPAHRLDGLPERSTFDPEVEDSLLEQHPLAGMVVLHLFEADRPPCVDSPDDRRNNGVFMVHVLLEHPIETLRPFAQGFQSVYLPRSDRAGQPIDLGDDRAQPSVLDEDPRANVDEGRC